MNRFASRSSVVPSHARRFSNRCNDLLGRILPPSNRPGRACSKRLSMPTWAIAISLVGHRGFVEGLIVCNFPDAFSFLPLTCIVISDRTTLNDQLAL